MPIDPYRPALPPRLDPHCIAAAALFGATVLRLNRQAEDPAIAGTPAAAVKRQLARTFDVLMQDMTELAAELGQEFGTLGASQEQER